MKKVAFRITFTAGMTLFSLSQAAFSSTVYEEDSIIMLRVPQNALDRCGRIPSLTSAVAERVRALGIEVKEEFRTIGALTARLSLEQAEQLRQDTAILSVGPNRTIYAPEYIENGDSQSENIPWHLDRLDQKKGPLDNNFQCQYTGKDVHIFILDGGVRETHQEFKGRMGEGFNSAEGEGKPPTDTVGHGTHVAGLAAGSTYGAAKNAIIHPVKVLSGMTGSISGIVKAVDWIVQKSFKPGVINMSFTMDGVSKPLEEAIRRTIDAGFTVIVAAGNSRKDASGYCPARMPEVITIGNMGRGVNGTGKQDWPAASSNYGKCLDVWSPGEFLVSASHNDDTSTVVKSGTSMAAPVAAGVVACYLEKYPDASPAQVEKAIINGAEKGAVGGLQNGSPNLLINTMFLSE